MRAHALVLLVIVGLVAPVRPAVGGGQTADAAWAEGHELVRRGAYAEAQQLYAALPEQFGAAVAPRALLLEARAALADADPDSAEAVLQQLLNDYPDSDQATAAYFTLEQVRRANGDCAGALRALDAFEARAGRTAIGPYAALQRAQCASRLENWAAELGAARAALAIDGGGPRLARIEAFERAAEAELKVGRQQDALEFYNRALELAATRAYKAEMLFTTATIARALGQELLAVERFRAVTVDYADQARAPGALDALVEMERGATVSPLQAGLVRLNGQEYRAAIALFDQVDSTNPTWGAAQVARADALLKLGDEDAAQAGLLAAADADPTQAGAALLRLGQVQMRQGALTLAAGTFERMSQTAPDRAAEALFHLGFVRFVRGDRAGALAAWQAGLRSGPPTPTMQTQLLYWSAKAAPDQAGGAREALRQAVATAPESYYGLRAQEQLGATLSIASVQRPANAAWRNLNASEVQERTAWLTGQSTTPQRVERDIATHPGLVRADALLELGLRTEAGWEIDEVSQQYGAARDTAHLHALADWLTARDLPHLTLRVGRQMRDLVGLEQLPRAAQKQVYPAGWGDLVADAAARHGVDPLLLLAMMRQESSFDPRAQSGAEARGLTQVVPPTARGIASRLGHDGFVLRDLFKPAISVEFGTWLLASLLADYRGRVFPALAAYNAGPGNAARWLDRFGDDPDLLVEQIPFGETQAYLRIVYDNYFHYQMLYGAP